ncbi:hypothetical protein HPB51_009056 [Rhipicephalus microplus]|uniref:Peptidase M14 domain-containing protein n=1 Tax=Rhipicephalus microplus TaxID=6941 RepID=A0A9J6D9J5_RHIMP|nr:hypothetical protein HPB51_009056 [Rhipicephalus microplus]
MTTGYGSDSTITTLLQTFDFYIFPLINPDGYAYTFTSDRLWRKNRSGGKRGCRGVDPNRNFDAAFGGAGTSGHPCSDIYRGARAFSEAESRAIRDAILALGSRVKGYVSVHSYSQLVMVPYGHGRATYTKDYADQIAAARAVSRAIQSRSGVYYQVGTISSLLGPAAGSSSDWAYDGAKIKYCIGVELRDKGRYGFLLPNFLIISSGGNSSRPAIWIDSGIHAREWISTASALYIIDHMLKSYNDSDDVTKLVDTFDWYIFPVINADGYKYTWTTHRLWRKNRVRNVGSLCRGVDPNRNFDVRFGLAGSSANPCAENFAGTYPFSEPESRAIRDGINNLKDRLKAYINLHSYSQVVMIPYGYSKGYTSDYKSQYEALEKLVTAIRKRNSAFYRHGTAGQTLYITSGAALDWVYDKAKVKHTFVVELRDRGLFGFILPREFITPTGDELFSGVKALAFHIMKAELKSS